MVISVLGESMAPTLQPNDRVLVLRFWPKYFLRKNDIVLISQKTENILYEAKHSLCIKRITGLPGDVVTIKRESHQFSNSSNKDRIFIVPHNQIFVQGDNIIKSIDSRHWGPIPYSNYSGLVVKRI